SLEKFDSKSGSVGLYPFQRMVLDLKKSIFDHIDDFLNQKVTISENEPLVNVLRPSVEMENSQKHEHLNAIDVSIYPFEEELAAIDLNLDEEKKIDEQTVVEEPSGEQSVFNERILQLLEDNNKILALYNHRFEDIQSQIDELKQERKAYSNSDNTEIKEEI